MLNESNKQDGERWKKEQIEERICRLCHWPLYLPMQLDCCGGRVCEKCATIITNIQLQCPFCYSLDFKTILDRGHLRVIENLKVTCPECAPSWYGLLKDLREHLHSHCTLKCKECNEAFLNQNQLEIHQHSTCTCRSICCPLASLGCSYKVPYSDMGKHCLELDHQQSILSFVKQHLLHSHNESENSSLQNDLHEQRSQMSMKYLEKIEAAFEEISPADNDCFELNSKKQIMETKLTQIRDELKKLNKVSLVSVKLLETIQQMLLEMNELINEIHEKYASSIILMATDNTYTFKINFLLLLNNNPSNIDSKPFQTSQCGYKLGISVAVQTEEQSKNRHVAISFLIFRGDYDAILGWPYSYLTTLCLMDLSGGRKHIIHSVQPDFRAEIFNRPLDNANKPYHIPDFCTIEELVENGSNYMHGGDMFVKMHVDFTGDGIHPF